MTATSRRLCVWVLQTGEPLPSDSGNPRPMRAMNLTSALIDAGHDVVLWSSDFYHQEKRHRSGGARTLCLSPRLEVRLVPSPGYRRNIGPRRLVDHAVLAWNLRRALRGATPPDVAFLGYPPIETAAVMGGWLKRRGVPHLLDPKDQWPSLFVEALPGVARTLGRVAFAPYFFLARRAMAEATGITAMSESFLEWALGVAGRPRRAADRVVPLSPPAARDSEADLQAASEWWDARGVRADGRARVCFIGSHSRAFDFAPVAEAARRLAADGANCQFVICGTGEETAAWQALARDLPQVVFPGWVDRPQARVLAARSIAALLPYHGSENFNRNLPNKVLDALSFGLPLVSPLRGEVESIITRDGVGLTYGAGDGSSLADRLGRLIRDEPARLEMGVRARRLFSDRFSYERVYGGLVRHLEELAGGRSAT